MPSTNSGRITALAIGPSCDTSACTLYVGAAGGGIWKTTNALADTPTWKAIDNGLDSNAIGSLIVDPTDPSGNTLYAGTGEPNGSSDSEAGLGLYKSTDGGTTWALVPGSVAVAKNRSVASLVVDPTNKQHLYMGTALARHGASSVYGGRMTPPDAPPLGLYESSNGGASFTLVFSQTADVVDPTTPNGNDFFKGGVTEVQLDPSDPSTVYIAVMNYGVWRRSPALDGTTAFRKVFGEINPDQFGERMDIAVTDKNGKTRVYVGVGPSQQTDSAGNVTVGATLWRTDDADVPAATLLASQKGSGGWENLSTSTPGTVGYGSYDFCQGQCSYDIFVESPAGHPDEVWIGGSMQYGELAAFGAAIVPSNGRAVMRSADAGVNFTDITNDAQAADVTFTRIDDGESAQPVTPGRFISGIAVDPADPNHAWISYSGYDAYTPETPGHVFEVRFDPGTGQATWKELSYDLGDQPINDIVYAPQNGDLYAATDFGVLKLAQGASSWSAASTGLPKTSVFGLTIAPDGQLLYAATHGRGAWRLNLSSLGEPTPTPTTEPTPSPTPEPSPAPNPLWLPLLTR